jgi:hypothetical protein
VIVGWVGMETPGEVSPAFIWDPIHGIRSLQTVLTDYGLDLTGWSLEIAYGVSDDGRTIVGRGQNPSGQTEAWIAVLPPLPACIDGFDNDGDDHVDLDDPGCPFPEAEPEDPPCDDGLDNDGDGQIDFDDPQCARHWPYWEALPACGLGVELAAVIPLALWLHRRRRRLEV